VTQAVDQGDVSFDGLCVRWEEGTMELGRMKMKLQDAVASKTLVDDMNASLQVTWYVLLKYILTAAPRSLFEWFGQEQEGILP